jgi:ribosome-binding ATPase
VAVLGLIGKPNVGKSSFFKAATLKDVEVADYPFTTIKPNVGVAHVSLKCPAEECNPRKGACIDGKRFVPIRLYDVAGLVPGAHEGKGLGNQFLDDARRSDVLIMVVDATGTTDAEGNQAEGDPVKDVEFVMEEFDRWLAGIVKKAGGAESLKTELAGLGIREQDVEGALRHAYPSGDCLEFASELRRLSKPAIIAANKSDRPESSRWLKKLRDTGYPVVVTSAAYEIALRKAAEAGFIRYVPGSGGFEVLRELDGNQAAALERVGAFLKKHGSTGVQEVLDRATFELAGMIAVFPVENENKWTDSRGNVLPDCLLVDRGTTAKELAYAVHTDIGDKFVRAVDARAKRAVSADHELSHCDIIKILTRA